MVSEGSLVKKIRIEKGLSQKNICDGIMTQSSYSKFEKGKIDLLSYKYNNVLSKLEISHDEFQYILNGHNYPLKKRIIYDFFSLNYNNVSKLMDIKQVAIMYLKENDDNVIQDICDICSGLINLSESNDIISARGYISNVWKRLEEHDNWYLIDLRLINTILFLFPPETAIFFADKAILKLEEYKDFKNTLQLTAHYKLNLTFLLVNYKKYKQGLKTIDSAILTCKLIKNHMQLAVCYVRKGILLYYLENKESEYYIQKGLNILTIIEEFEILEAIKYEIDINIEQS